MNAQAENISRVTEKLGPAILDFFKERGVGAEFRAQDLRDHVSIFTGEEHAPASAQRIMQLMRTLGQLDYEVTNRRQSLYKIVPNGTSKFFGTARDPLAE